MASPSSTLPAADPSRYCLANGYTEYTVTASDHLPLPWVNEACVACGAGVNWLSAGRRRKYRSTERRFCGLLYLCRRCAKAGFGVDDFVEVGLGDTDLTVRIGSPAVARRWRAACEAYCQALVKMALESVALLQDIPRPTVAMLAPASRQALALRERQVPAADAVRRVPLIVAPRAGCLLPMMAVCAMVAALLGLCVR